MSKHCDSDIGILGLDATGPGLLTAVRKALLTTVGCDFADQVRSEFVSPSCRCIAVPAELADECDIALLLRNLAGVEPSAVNGSPDREIG